MGDFRDHNEDVQRIKYAILQSQYETGRVANSNQPALYYGIGGYVSANARSGKWGTGALSSISNRLQRELPGLRGFSERNLKYTRTFFEEWQEQIEGGRRFRHLQVPKLPDFPLEEFLTVGFTSHCQILTSAKDLDERLFYIERADSASCSRATRTGSKSIPIDECVHL